MRGHVACGDVIAALTEAKFEAAGEFESGFVEHAYIEPEAGFARRVGDTIEVQACTQAPYMDRADLAAILALDPEAVRVIPTAVGGGFGLKLDLSMQPFVALAAWHLRRPVRMVYSRSESMMSTTKRHPSRIRARVAAGRDGRLTAMDFFADFNTGAYSSGTDGGGARSHSRLRALSHSPLPRANPGGAYQPGSGRRVSRIWSAAGGHGAGAAF